MPSGNPVLANLGFTHTEVTRILVDADELRNTFKKVYFPDNEPRLLLKLNKSDELVAFNNAISQSSQGVTRWLANVVALVVTKLEARSGQRLPPFSLIADGSFGRQELSPESDLDCIVLCATEHIDTLKTVFVDNLRNINNALRAEKPAFTGPNPYAPSFAISFELSPQCWSPQGLAQGFTGSADRPGHLFTSELFPIFDNGPNTFYRDLNAFRSQKPWLARSLAIAQGGLDTVAGNSRYTNARQPRDPKAINIKSALSCFQRGMAVLSYVVAPQAADPTKTLPGATEWRLAAIARGLRPSPPSNIRDMYLSVLALRAYMHLSSGHEQDWTSEAGPEVYARFKALKDSGLDACLDWLNDVLRAACA